MPTSIPNTLKQHITNALGKKTNRKIIVIESDDWGTIRMPSRKIYDILKKQGLNIDDPYNRYDSLATEEDLSALFDILATFKDHNGRHPTLTANCLVANPDFKRIKDSGYTKYFFEPFTETLRQYAHCENSFSLWKEGIQDNLFHPQFHGREHLNISSWLFALQHGDPDTLCGFGHGFWGHTIRRSGLQSRPFLAAYHFRSLKEEDRICQIINEGMGIFKEIFGYKSRSVIAPKFIWSSKMEKAFSACGANLIQSQRNQLIPSIHKPGFQTKFHYSGQKNSLAQTYLVRNALFEPTSAPNNDWVDSCLKDISRAFLWKTPAIISAHRVNFIGAIMPENRDKNLIMLKELLRKILLRWPTVEFLTTDQLFFNNNI